MRERRCPRGCSMIEGSFDVLTNEVLIHRFVLK